MDYRLAKLIEACKRAIQQCECSFQERHTGHLVDCFAPGLQAAVEEAESELYAGT